jgi:hypothetical protein
VCVCDYRRGFESVNRFIDHLKVVTTINCNTVASSTQSSVLSLLLDVSWYLCILGIVIVIVVFSFCVGCSLCVYFVYCVSFDRCVILYDMCYFCMMCVICVLCLIVVPLPPGENPFAVKYRYIIYLYVCMYV